MRQHATKCASRELPLLVAGGNPVYRECTCDGYHTFDELYDHRITLYIALCRRIADNRNLIEYMYEPNVWRSQRHSDGSNIDGWFVLGIGTDKGDQITYHIPNERWDETAFAETLDHAPEWDGHTSDDALTRLKQL